MHAPFAVAILKDGDAEFAHRRGRAQHVVRLEEPQDFRLSDGQRARISARCEIDLSPGTSATPLERPRPARFERT